MKTTTLLSLAAAVALTPLAVFAQSAAASTNLANSAAHSAAASQEILLAGGHAVAGSVRLASGVLAVPVWMSGAVATGSGAALAGVGDSLVHSGKAAGQTAQKMWDAATGDPAERPALNREVGLPKPRPTAAAASRSRDPAPAEVLKTIGR
ncbi:MAG: hypothetical protein HY302_02290 [Opitutae bacterium]|nr:hypothetical protein [Opitutae bacterium]